MVREKVNSVVPEIVFNLSTLTFFGLSSASWADEYEVKGGFSVNPEPGIYFSVKPGVHYSLWKSSQLGSWEPVKSLTWYFSKEELCSVRFKMTESDDVLPSAEILLQRAPNAKTWASWQLSEERAIARILLDQNLSESWWGISSYRVVVEGQHLQLRADGSTFVSYSAVNPLQGDDLLMADMLSRSIEWIQEQMAIDVVAGYQARDLEVSVGFGSLDQGFYRIKEDFTADLDGDQIRDWWELENFTSLNVQSDGAADSDEDGATLSEESEKGMSPFYADVPMKAGASVFYVNDRVGKSTYNGKSAYPSYTPNGPKPSFSEAYDICEGGDTIVIETGAEGYILAPGTVFNKGVTIKAYNMR